MISTVSYPDIKINVTSKEVTDSEAIAELVTTLALEQAREKLTRVEQALPLAELLSRRDFFDSFKYNLVKNVAGVLGDSDKHVREIYLFDSGANPDIETGEYLPLDGTVRLLVVVQSASAALNALIGSLDRTLTEHLKTLPSPLFKERHSVLTVNLVSREEIERGTGYAGLLSAVFVPPLRVW